MTLIGVCGIDCCIHRKALSVLTVVISHWMDLTSRFPDVIREAAFFAKQQRLSYQLKAQPKHLELSGLSTTVIDDGASSPFMADDTPTTVDGS